MTEKSNQEEFRISSTMWFDLVKSVAVLVERVDAQATATNVLRDDMMRQISSVRDDVTHVREDVTQVRNDVRHVRDDMMKQTSSVRDDVRFCFKLYVGLIAVLGGAVVVHVVERFFV